MSWMLFNGESFLTSNPIISGAPRITRRMLGECGKSFLPPTLIFCGPRYAIPMSTPLTSAKSSSPLLSSGSRVLVPVYGWTVAGIGPASLATLATPLASA